MVAVFILLFYTIYNYRMPQAILESLLIIRICLRTCIVMPNPCLLRKCKGIGKIPSKQEITDWIEEKK